jgi:hypothetical protein
MATETARRPRTAEDIEAANAAQAEKVEALNAELVAAVEALADSNAWRRMLEVSARFTRTRSTIKFCWGVRPSSAA